MENPQAAFQNRGRSKSSFSFRSASGESDPGREKVDVSHLKETEKGRQKSKWKSKGTKDPNSAINAAQPAERAVNENVTLPYLRSVEHKDWKGDPIVDPDVSNPTRPRMERPLDTIRSFEAAIDNAHKRKAQMNRSENADQTAMSSRRNSFVGGNESPYNRHSTPAGPHHTGRGNYQRNGDNYQPRPNPYRSAAGPMGPPPVQEYAEYPQYGHRESRDTAYTGESNGYSSSEPWGNSTDPSSENSSIDRIHAANRPDSGDAYGYNQGQPERISPRHDAIQEEYGHDGTGYTQGHYAPPHNQPRKPSGHGPGGPQQGPNGYNNGANGYSNGPSSHQNGARNDGRTMAPPPPSHQRQQQPQRNVIPLGGGNAGPAPPAHNEYRPRPPPKGAVDDGKRKSWLKRRFSKG